MSEPILVWPFYDAPEELKELSPHGGDEDWLAVLPPEYREDYVPYWMGTGSDFGRSETRIVAHPTKPGFWVAIGAHA